MSSKQKPAQRLSKYGYKLVSSETIEGTFIYETIGPHGSYVYVSVPPSNQSEYISNKAQVTTKLKKGIRTQDIQSAIKVAETSCQYLTGYVILHSSVVVVKPISEQAQYINTAAHNKLRIAPLLTIQEIEQDSESSATNSDNASALIHGTITLGICEKMEEYDRECTKAVEEARKYFDTHCTLFDDTVNKAREIRTKMVFNEDGTHATDLSDRVTALETLHQHSIKISKACEYMRKTSEMYKELHKEIS